MWDWLERETIFLWYYLDIQIRQIAPYWALGIVLGSAVSVFGKKYIHGAFAKIGQHKMGWLGVIPASLLGIASPLCMYGTIPIAASFSEQGVKDDYLAAFMITGPATKITNLGAMKIVLGWKRFVIYLAYVMLFSLTTGLLVDLII